MNGHLRNCGNPLFSIASDVGVRLRVSAGNPNPYFSEYFAGDTSEEGPYEEFLPGERIGAPFAGTRRKAKMRGIIFLLILGGGWAAYGGQVNWQAWTSALTAVLSPAIERQGPGPVEPVSPKLASADAPLVKAPPGTALGLDGAPPSAQQDVAPRKADAVAETPAAKVVETAALPPAAASTEDAVSSPLPPPVSAPNDPYQKRALAAGLHPGLSRALLAKLTAADFRNAGVAIQTALAETPDNDSLVWPRQHKPELALFQVSFVPGAAANCRRYVVTVGKDGWSTTALPMETCGVKRVAAKHP